MGRLQVKSLANRQKNILSRKQQKFMLKIAHSLSLALGFIAACACGLCGIERSNTADANGESSPAGIIKNTLRSTKIKNSSENSKRISSPENGFEFLYSQCEYYAAIQNLCAICVQSFPKVIGKINAAYNVKYLSKFHRDPSNPIRAPSLKA